MKSYLCLVANPDRTQGIQQVDRDAYLRPGIPLPHLFAIGLLSVYRLRWYLLTRAALQPTLRHLYQQVLKNRTA